MTTRRARLIAEVEQAFKEKRERDAVERIREWRDTPGATRSLLFGEGDGELPFFVVVIEHAPVPTRTKHRGLSIGDATRQALQTLMSKTAP